MSIETVGLWWLIVMSFATIVRSVLMIDKPQGPVTRGVAVGYIVWSLTYILFYAYLLGAFK